MINIQNITKVYNGTQVLHIDQLQIQHGESIGLVGNNGAGKTTLFSLMLDLIQPTTGHISINDVKVNENETWKQYVGSFIDESFLIGYLTPEEYFYFVGELRGANKEVVDAFLEKHHDFFNDEILDKKKYLRDLSKGNQKKVGIIAALIGDPEVIILDEPFANLDPTTQIRLKNLIKNLTQNKDKTVIISSHDLMHTIEVSDRIIVLQKGEMVKDLQKSTETLTDLEQFFTI